MPRRGRGFWYGVMIELLWPVLAVLTRLGWRGGECLPVSGGFLLVANHVSFADPIVDTAFVLAHGRVPRYLAKAELWEVPLGRWVLGGGGHIPVRRATIAAGDAYRSAVAAVTRGECLVVYPESTYTRRPDGWPMRGMNGVARIALATGVPAAHWGAQEVVPPGRGRLPPAAAPAAGAGAGRPAAGPVSVRRTAAEEGGAGRGHGRHHGRDHRPGRGAARGGATRRSASRDHRDGWDGRGGVLTPS